MTETSKKTILIGDADAVPLYRKLCYGRAIFLASYVALLMLFTSLNIIFPDGGIKLWLVQCVPLLIFVPGLYQQRHRTYSWICFVILPYFTWSVVNAMSPLIRWSDIVVVSLTVIIFISAMMVSRWQQYWQLYLHQARARALLTTSENLDTPATNTAGTTATEH